MSEETESLIPEDHDQRFKALIRLCFAEFMELFFADWAERFDFTNVEWLGQELLPHPPDGTRHRLDLVAKVNTKVPVESTASEDPNTWLAVVMIEVESPDSTTSIKSRLPGYYIHLSATYGLPVLPVVLYLSVGLNGIGHDSVVRKFWDLEVMRLDYLYVGLPALDGEVYLHGDNWLGVALSALMKLPKERISELGLEALRRLRNAGLTEYKTHLLSECFEAYVSIEDAELQRIAGILKKEFPRRQTMRPRNKTSYDRDLERVRRLATIELLEAMLESQFGPLASESLDRLRQMPDDVLKSLATKIFKAQSLAELGL